MFVFCKANAPLDRYIAGYWYADLQISYQREKILPSGTLELIINFGAPFRLYEGGGGGQFTLQTDSWLVGMQTAALINEPCGETHMVGVRFKPGGTYPFFHYPAWELHNQVIAAEGLWGRFVNEARERLLEAKTVEGRFALLEKMLLARLSEGSSRYQTVQHALELIARQDGNVVIEELSAYLGFSQKHLAALFKEMVGVAPKTMARLLRFQRVLAEIDPRRDVDWTQIAADCLYYDQAHFNKDFTGFTGLTPGEYLQLRLGVYGASLKQGDDVHFVPLR